MISRLFGKKKKPIAPEPDIYFGRYSDNNKMPEKINRWTEADKLFRERRFLESLDAFFDYLRDNDAGNVVYERRGEEGNFHFFQGSRIIRGYFNADGVHAEASLAEMPTLNVPVMRRLLEMNFNLYYTCYALDDNRLCMRFDTEIRNANPSKMYYGLKELATKADKQDDLLVQDFTALEPIDSQHVIEIPGNEKELKYLYLTNWIEDTLEKVGELDEEKFSGAIAYLLLALAYRIDYLITPEGKLMREIESIVETYFKKDERPVTEKNRDMLQSFRKMKTRTREEVFPFLFRSRYTFSIVTPQTFKTVTDAIHNANQNISWYRENGYHEIARQICEYGIAYCQYSYSLPKPVSEFFHIFMQVNYSRYFEELGFSDKLFDMDNGGFNRERIIEKIKSVENTWRKKYPLMEFRTEKLSFTNLVRFNESFTKQIENMNLDSR